MKKLKLYFAGIGLITIIIGLFLLSFNHPVEVYAPVIAMGLAATLSFYYEKR